MEVKVDKLEKSMGNYSQFISDPQRNFMKELELNWRFSVQQLSQFIQWTVDCQMWKEPEFLKNQSHIVNIVQTKYSHWTITQKRDWMFQEFHKCYTSIKGKEKEYPKEGIKEDFPKYKMGEKELKGRIFRLCPAASERAVCCNLKVLNIVDNCAMECSYCVLQNHYDEPEIKIPNNLKEKLQEIKLNPDKKYRICTGEYSDSLLWGNKNNILKDLCDFAKENKNIILEFKTKTTNVHFFLENEVPKNICCSWSLNPSIIVQNEEQKTAPVEKRLEAARTVADKGIKVGFHLHPMMYFKGWEQEYQKLIQQITNLFSPNEVLWVSLGTVTLMKGFDHELRTGYKNSKVLQMDMQETPDGKITYAFEVREKLYKNALEVLRPWKNEVFQYLCMEHKPMWDSVMDYTYPNIKEFEDEFNDSAFGKIS